ncbi:MAG: hypothetical protein HY690_20420 [Chloroflexi bacterium]|nr:hypothetical protein [Chloroflexota bacterium]
MKLGQAPLEAASGASRPRVAEVMRCVDDPSAFIVLLAWSNRAAAGQQPGDLFTQVGSWAMGQLSERIDKTYETPE